MNSYDVIVMPRLWFFQAKAEQEEEFISNTLLKKIQELKKEKENLALNYEQEEECLTKTWSGWELGESRNYFLEKLLTRLKFGY